MTPRFFFHQAARAELREARDWYEAQRPDLGGELGEVISETVERIRNHPEFYPELMPGVRRAVLRRFPYSLFYRRRQNDIEILAVFHHRRDPSVWRRRAVL